MMRLVDIAVAIGLLATSVAGQAPKRTDAVVCGVVSTVDASATHAGGANANISPDGPIHVRAQSDSEGKFVFSAVPSGSYTITAQAPGMTTQQSVTVTAGAVSEITLEMKVQTVVESTTVTASADSIDTKQSSGTN